MQISQSINKFSLSPLYSWIRSGIMTLPVCMDTGRLMCLPLISLQLYSTFGFCLVTSQPTLLFDSSLLPSECTLPLHIYHTMYKNKHSVIFQTLPIIPMPHSTEIVKRGEWQLSYTTPWSHVYMEDNPILFTLGFISVSVWLIKSMSTSAGST